MLRAAWMAAEVMTRYPDKVGSITLVAGVGGRFEVKLNDQLIFSKAQTGRFPELNEITKPIEAWLAAQAPSPAPTS